MLPTDTEVSNKRIVKRIAPIQLGKVLGILYGMMGLLFIPIFLFVSAIGSQLPEAQRTGVMAFGAGFAIAMPIIYGVMGFFAGIISALIYNVAAKWVGGIEVEVETE